MQLERDVEAYLGKSVRKLGGRCVKFLPDEENGMPDRLVLLPGGIVVWVELKNGETEKARKLQQLQHKRLRDLGQIVCVGQTKAQIDNILDRYGK